MTPSPLPPTQPRPPTGGSALWRTVFRGAVILVIAVMATMLIDLSLTLTASLPEANQTAIQIAIIVGALLIYMLLMATPFVPGIEIGLALLMLRGAEVAPAVYIATVAGLLLAYMLGSMIPIQRLERVFLDVRLRRAAAMVAQIAPLAPSERLALLNARLPAWAGAHLVRGRYLLLAAALNMPGNALLGGGGGIMVLIGLSGLFNPLKIMVTIALAVAPLPLLIWLMGEADMPPWLPF